MAKTKKPPDINKILRRPENTPSAKYGAQLGRMDEIGDPCCLRVQRVRFVDGDYDAGGVYWGGGRDVEPLYCLFSDEDAGVEEATMMFVRAKNYAAAIEDAKKVLDVDDGWTFHPYEPPQ